MFIKGEIVKNKDFSCFKFSDIVFILLINVKMPTKTFMSRINFMLN